MAEITVDWIGAKLNAVLDEVRSMRSEVSAMRAEIASFRQEIRVGRNGGVPTGAAGLNKAENPCEVR
jgi:hypothetical protein